MTSTTTSPRPDVPLPAGAVFGDIWQGDPAERVIMGQNRGITDSDVVIWTSAIQLADGRIELDEGGVSEPPLCISMATRTSTATRRVSWPRFCLRSPPSWIGGPGDER